MHQLERAPVEVEQVVSIFEPCQDASKHTHLVRKGELGVPHPTDDAAERLTVEVLHDDEGAVG